MRLQSIEEVDVAAPRARRRHRSRRARSSRPQKVDNLVGGETRQPKSQAGQGRTSPRPDGDGAPAERRARRLRRASFSTRTTRRATSGSSSAVASASAVGVERQPDAQRELRHVLDSAGATSRRDTDFSPYVGGGLSWEYLSLLGAGLRRAMNSGSARTSTRASEILRTHHTHLALGAAARSAVLRAEQQRRVPEHDSTGDRSRTPRRRRRSRRTTTTRRSRSRCA